MLGRKGQIAPSIPRALFGGLLYIGLPITLGTIGLFSIILWLVVSKIAGGQIAFVAALSTLGGSLVTLAAQTALHQSGRMMDEAAERLQVMQGVYSEVEENRDLAAHLIENSLATGLAVRPFNETAWVRGKVQLSFLSQLDTPEENAARLNLYSTLLKHYDLIEQANRELVLREQWSLRGNLHPDFGRMIEALDHSLRSLWRMIAEEAPEVRKLFLREAKELEVRS